MNKNLHKMKMKLTKSSVKKWTESENQRFLEAVKLNSGNVIDYQSIAAIVGTRTADQCWIRYKYLRGPQTESKKQKIKQIIHSGIKWEAETK